MGFALVPAPAQADSDVLLRLLRASPLPPPETKAPLGPFEIDLLWRDHRLAVDPRSREARAS